MGAMAIPGYRKGKIQNVRERTHDVVSFEVSLDTPIAFDAGQFVVLETAEVTGGRAYSMANVMIRRGPS